MLQATNPKSTTIRITIGKSKRNAYGLANTLKQTAILKPQLKNKNLSNFYYTGQLTVPGPGVPPSIISGEVVAKEIIKSIFKFFVLT
jgi:phytoene desaturase